MKARLICLTVTFLAIAAGLLVPAVPAQAATGSYWPVQATCEYGRITVTSPQMSPSFNVAVTSNGLIVIDPTQWVAFKPHLAKWNGSSWVIVDPGRPEGSPGHPAGGTASATRG